MQVAGEYDIRLAPRARRDLKRVSSEEFERIDERISALASDPRPMGTVKLWDQSYRIRVGRWRVLYIVDDGNRVIVITAVRRRDESTYRRR